MPSEISTTQGLVTQLLALTSYGGLIVLFFCFLLICGFGAYSVFKFLKNQKRAEHSIERSKAKRESLFLYESVRQQMDDKLTKIINQEENELGEYLGTDLIERLNLELINEEIIARALPVGDPEAIARLQVIGDWRLQLQRGLSRALEPTGEA